MFSSYSWSHSLIWEMRLHVLMFENIFFVEFWWEMLDSFWSDYSIDAALLWSLQVSQLLTFKLACLFRKGSSSLSTSKMEVDGRFDPHEGLHLCLNFMIFPAINAFSLYLFRLSNYLLQTGQSGKADKDWKNILLAAWAYS